MAVVTLEINIPDNQTARLQAALRGVFDMPTATNAELTERLRQEVIGTIKGIVIRYERQQAVSLAELADYNVDAT